MVTEIIDLSGSPSFSSQSFRSSQAPKILDFASGSVMSICPNFNGNLYYTNPEQTIWFPTSGSYSTYQPYHVSSAIQTYMHGRPDSRAFLFPNGTRHKEPLMQRENELFKMGLIKYGNNGHCCNVTKHFKWNKKPQQVQNYAARFSSHLPNKYLYNFKRRNNVTYHHGSNTMIRNNNPMGVSGSCSMPMIIANEPKEQKTLMLFPEKHALFPSGKANKGDTATTYGYGFKMLTNGRNTSMTSIGNEEVDLELRLGY
ncbi:hypothetical protein Lal_00026969 [Lupinus albus]|uniref:Uncharacterized protein n=1 Tax=Lupinus albus TaxID=3870 RepID=A0A6A4Q0X8_LUPAL|nr:hypothetical protein Lalb_Chr09g0330471 [Lupinus albus]KAF1862435.1 hypothetical protein Lal_00026969 [Lupinus albus]